MNKRIQELMEQAQDWVDQRAPFASEEHEWFAEKFAELIVRECIDIVSPYAIRMENFDGGHPIVDLKKHFGVKSEPTN